MAEQQQQQQHTITLALAIPIALAVPLAVDGAIAVAVTIILALTVVAGLCCAADTLSPLHPCLPLSTLARDRPHHCTLACPHPCPPLLPPTNFAIAAVGDSHRCQAIMLLSSLSVITITC